MATFVTGLSFIFNRFPGVFRVCSRIKAVSTPIYPPSSFGWHWGMKRKSGGG